MEVDLTPDREAHLVAPARRVGRSPDELAKEAVLRFLGEEPDFAEAIKLGVAAADNGQFVAPEEVWEGVERILLS